MFNLMIKNKQHWSIYRGKQTKYTHYVDPKKKQKFKDSHWPKHPRMDRVRDIVYSTLDVLGKIIVKLKGKV